MADFNLLNRTAASEPSTIGARMADPMKDMMAAVAKEKREEVEKLSAEFAQAQDAGTRESLEGKLAKARHELQAAERAAGIQTMAVIETPQPEPPTPEPNEAAQTAGPKEELTMPRGATVPLPPAGAENMSKEQLEALVHELQLTVEATAIQIHHMGPEAPIGKVQELETLRARLLGATYALAEVTRRENSNPNWNPAQLPPGFVMPPPPAKPQVQKPPSRAALEAQVRELQVELLERARDVERAPIHGEKERAKLEETRDKLQEAMRALSATTKNEITELAGVLPPKPTAQQAQEAESLLRQANVAKMRGNKLQAREMIEKAALIAPGSVAVLQVFGEDLADQGKVKQALEIFAKAFALDPENAHIERMYGEMVYRSKGMPSAEEFARMMDSGLATEDSASKKSAILMSILLPGLGQIVMGRTIFGGSLMGTWLLMLAWMTLMPEGIQSLLKSIAGVGANFNPFVLVPLFIAVVVHIVAVATAGGGDGGRKGTITRPKPPADLPFE